MHELMVEARNRGIGIPAFNIPYLPMMPAVVQALRDCNCFGLITVARLEWVKFESESLSAVRQAYNVVADPEYTRLHLDHTPVIDEDDLRVDYLEILAEALSLGYDSVMVDGSRLPLEENIAATRHAAQLAHEKKVPLEAELGAVMGHEKGPLPPYEELYRSGRGFTDPDEAVRFVTETGADWLSVAIGNVHGAISAAQRGKAKIAAKLNIDHLKRLADATRIPLVLHGGTGIPSALIQQAVAHGVAKINVATAIRQPYEAAMRDSIDGAMEAVYVATKKVICEELDLAGTAETLCAGA